MSDFFLHQLTGGTYYRQVKYKPLFTFSDEIGVGIRFHEFWEGSDMHWRETGIFVIGRRTKSLDRLQEMPSITYEGYAYSDPSIYVNVQLNPHTGIIKGCIHGSVGELYFESGTQSLSQSMYAKLYSLDENGTKKIEGSLLLALYGEEAKYLAGGFVSEKFMRRLGPCADNQGRQGRIIFLEKVSSP